MSLINKESQLSNISDTLMTLYTTNKHKNCQIVANCIFKSLRLKCIENSKYEQPTLHRDILFYV